MKFKLKIESDFLNSIPTYEKAFKVDFQLGNLYKNPNLSIGVFNEKGDEEIKLIDSSFIKELKNKLNNIHIDFDFLVLPGIHIDLLDFSRDLVDLHQYAFMECYQKSLFTVKVKMVSAGWPVSTIII